MIAPRRRTSPLGKRACAMRCSGAPGHGSLLVGNSALAGSWSSAVFSVAWWVAILCLPPGGESQAGVWNDLWLRPDQQAARDLAAGHEAEAAERFTDPAWRAAARYQAGDYAGALRDLADLAGTEADYNRGNALARAGRLREALAAYDRALEADPGHADAAHNRALVEQALARQAASPNGSDQKGEGEDTGDGAPSGPDGSDRDSSGRKDQSDSPGAGDTDGAAGDVRKQGQATAGGPAGSSEPEGDQAAGSNNRGAAASAGQGQGQEQRRPSKRDPEAVGRPQPVAEGPAPDLADEGPHDGGLAGPKSGDEAAGGVSGGSENRTDTDAAVDGRSATPGVSRGVGDLQPGAEPRRDDLVGRGDPPVERTPPQGDEAMPRPASPAEREAEQAFEQMLRRVPDDPAGLLRQRFLLEHLRRHGR